MIGRFWAVCEGLWGAITSAATTIAEYGAARRRGCHQRMRAAIGLPPLP